MTEQATSTKSNGDYAEKLLILFLKPMFLNEYYLYVNKYDTIKGIFDIGKRSS